jgi:hypothetical protein
VYDCFVVLGWAELAERQALEEEYWVRHRATGRRARENQERNALKKTGAAAALVEAATRLAAAEEPEGSPTAEPPTPGEGKLLDSLRSLILRSFPTLYAALPLLPLSEKTFRATLSNPSRLLPLSTLHRQDMERYLGDILGERLEREGWKVKLVGAELDAHVRLLPSCLRWTDYTLRDQPPMPVLEKEPQPTPPFPQELTALLSLQLQTPAVPAHRLPPLKGGSTPLSPPIAHLMGVIYATLPLSSNAASPVVLDPCAGTLSIPRELAALSSAGSPFLSRTGASFDLHPNPFPQLPLVPLAGDVLPFPLPLSPSLDAILMSSSLPLPLRPHPPSAGTPAANSGLIGGTITDLPWGTRHLSRLQISSFYPALLRRMGVAVESGGWGVVMSAARGALEGALKGAEGVWERRGKREVRVGGRTVWVWVVRRK